VQEDVHAEQLLSLPVEQQQALVVVLCQAHDKEMGVVRRDFDVQNDRAVREIELALEAIGRELPYEDGACLLSTRDEDCSEV